jgi:predicted metalloprotease
MASQTFKLNQAAEETLAQVASKSGLNRDQALGAALAVANDADAAQIKAKAAGDEDTQNVSGRDWIRIGILVSLFLLLIGAVLLAVSQVSPRSISVESATQICKASAEVTGSKTCDPATVLSNHQTDWQSSLLALLAALFAPILTLFSASVGYYFGKAGSANGDAGGG